MRSPEPIVDNRRVEVCGLDNIVFTIDVLIADNLYNNLFVSIFLHIDGCNVLEDVSCQHSLQQDEVFVAICRLYNSQIINVSIAIEVEVGDVRLLVVEFLLEFFKISTLTEESSNGLEIEFLRDVLVRGTNRNRFVCSCRPSERHYHGRKDKQCTCLHKRVI